MGTGLMGTGAEEAQHAVRWTAEGSSLLNAPAASAAIMLTAPIDFLLPPLLAKLRPLRVVAAAVAGARISASGSIDGDLPSCATEPAAAVEEEEAARPAGAC